MACPFCGDTKNHCGINLTTKVFNCWICGERGNIVKLITCIENCTYHEAIKVLEKYPDTTFSTLRQDILVRNKHNILPEDCTKVFPQQHLDYLESRRFNPNFLIEKYNLHACADTERYKNRIIVPIVMNHQITNFTAMDVTRTQHRIKYVHCPNNEAIVPMAQCLYNIDTVKKNSPTILVEGVADVWRFGDGTVACMGTNFTQQKQQALIDTKPNHLYIMLDHDAIKKAHGLADGIKGHFYSYGISVSVVELEKGDPADFTDQEAFDLKQTLKIGV